MNKDRSDILMFVFSFFIMFLGILFFIGLSMVYEINFNGVMAILLFGWITFHSFLVIINIFVQRFRDLNKQEVKK